MANKFRLHKLSRVDQFVMSYGGLRGAVAFALVLLIDEHHVKQKPMFVTTTIAVIYFTVFLQGITIKPLVKILNVKRANKKKPTMNERIHERVSILLVGSTILCHLVLFSSWIIWWLVSRISLAKRVTTMSGINSRDSTTNSFVPYWFVILRWVFLEIIVWNVSTLRFSLVKVCDQFGIRRHIVRYSSSFLTLFSSQFLPNFYRSWSSSCFVGEIQRRIYITDLSACWMLISFMNGKSFSIDQIWLQWA